MTLKENVFLSAKDSQIFITSWKQDTRWGKLPPAEEFTNEEKKFKWPATIFVIKGSRKKFNTESHPQNKCPQIYQIIPTPS